MSCHHLEDMAFICFALACENMPEISRKGEGDKSDKRNCEIEITKDQESCEREEK